MSMHPQLLKDEYTEKYFLEEHAHNKTLFNPSKAVLKRESAEPYRIKFSSKLQLPSRTDSTPKRQNSRPSLNKLDLKSVIQPLKRNDDSTDKQNLNEIESQVDKPLFSSVIH